MVPQPTQGRNAGGFIIARIALFVGLLLAFAGVGFLVFRASAPDTLDVQRDGATGSETMGRVDRETGDDAGSSVSPRITERDRQSPERNREPSESSNEAVESDEPFAGVRVRVVDTRGAAVAGVPIVIRAPHADNPDFDVLLGGPGLTDDRGEAEVRYYRGNDAEQLMLTSEHGLRVACALPIESPPEAGLRRPQEPGEYLRLEITDEGLAWLEPVLVRVERADGSGVPGVDVVLNSRRENETGRLRRADFAMTGADGIAEMSRNGQREQILAGDRLQSRVEFELTVNVPLVDPPRAAMPDPDARLVGRERTEPDVRLVLPATGELVASVYDAAGDVAEGAAVRLSYWNAKQRSGRAALEGWAKDAEFIDGKWRLEPIGTGLQLEVRAWYPDGRAPAVQTVLSGPSFDGEEVAATLRFAEEFPFVTGRVVFPGADEPIRHLDGRLGAESSNRPSKRREPFRSGFGVEIESDGTFRFRLRTLDDEDPPNLLELADRARTRIGRVSLPVVTPSTSVDVGTVEMRELPVLAAGRVVDEAGLVVPNAVVRASEPVEGSDGRFRDVSLATTSAGRDGRFEIRAIDPPDRVRLLASDRGSKAGRIEVDAGRTDVEIVVRDETERGGTVAGRVLLDDGISLDHVEVMLEGADGRHAVRGISETGGGFEFRGVSPGRVDVEVRTRPAKLAIERIEDIAVVEGESSRDDRVAWIDLRGRLRYLRVRLVDGDGAAWARERVIVTPVGSTRGGSVMTDENGHLAALLVGDAERVRLSSRTIRSTEIDFSDDDRTVTVERR